MGNPTADSLPRCQLLQLYGLLQHQDLATDAGDAQGDLLPWCDTLCCPVEPKEAKDRALTYMRRTYEDATHVLVLDTSLRLHDSATLSPEELCVRIFASGWMRRLWTLQEGSLPSEKWRLWFQFRDRAVNLRPLWQNALDVLQNQVSRRGIAVEIISHIRAFTAFSQGKVYDSDGLGADLALVEAALKHRSVSVPSDEPLLISNLLGLDIGKLLGGPGDTRIHRLWSLMPSARRGIPKIILFRLGPRLKTQGFRWAPSTLLFYQNSNGIL